MRCRAEEFAIYKIAEMMTLPLRPQGVSSPLVNRTPKGRGAKAEINLAIDSDSLPLGTPSLTAKPKSLMIADSVLNRLQKLTHSVSLARSAHRTLRGEDI